MTENGALLIMPVRQDAEPIAVPGSPAQMVTHMQSKISPSAPRVSKCEMSITVLSEFPDTDLAREV